MANFLFVVKTLVISLLVVTLLQVHIGGNTLEQHMVGIASHSVIITPIEGVVEAVAVSMHRSWDHMTNYVKSRAFRPGSRENQLKLERHPDVIKKTEEQKAL